MTPRLLAVLATGLCTGSCFAQSGTGAEPQPEPQPEARPEPLLAGPKVEESRLPGVEDTLTGASERMRGMSAEPAPAAVFRRAIHALRDAEGDARLTDEQSVEIEGLEREHATALREYMAEHRDEINRLRRAARRVGADRPGPSDRPPSVRSSPDAGAGMQDDSQQIDPQELRRRIQEIRRQGPQEIDLQTRGPASGRRGTSRRLPRRAGPAAPGAFHAAVHGRPR